MKTTLNPLIAVALLLGFNAAADPLPDLVPLNLQIPPIIRAPPNPLIQVTWAVTNQGDGEATGYWNDLLYLSTRSFVDSTATFLTYQGAPSPVEPGDTYWSTNQLNLPIVQSGFYYLIVKANAYQYLIESNPNNNELAAGFSFEPTPADLSPLSLVVSSNVSGPPNPMVTVAWGVTNLGPGYASGFWSDTLFFSSHPTLDSTAVAVTSQGESGPVPVGGRYWRTNLVRFPVVKNGTYYLIFKTDQDNSLHEDQTNNNLAVVTVTFNIQPPDLAPLALLAPNVLTSPPNPNITFIYAVTNQGTGPAIGNYFWDDRIYFSADTNIQWTDALIIDNYESGPIPPGNTYWRTNNVLVPAVNSGNYYLILQTDASGWLYESDTNNNTLIVPIALTIQRPDLVPLTQFPSEISGPPFPIVTLVYGATNQGVGAALGSWTDFIFFATNADATLQGTAFGFPQSGPISPGAVYWKTNTIRVPAVQDGTYYLALESDYYANLYESDRSNNIVSGPINIHILPPDLSPIALVFPTVITSPPNPQLTFIWGITNQGIGPAIGNSSWSDILYISTNAFWDNTAITLNSSSETGPVDPGGSYWRTNVLHVPVVQSGTYYFFLKVDSWDNLVESHEQNNQLAVTVSFVVQPPDLAPLVSPIPTNFTGPPNPMLSLVWGVTNQGPGLAQGYWAGWYDGIFFSTDSILDSQDLDIGGWLGGGPLAPNASYWYTNNASIPVTQSGTYYLIFKTDRNDSILESDKSNNIAVVPISFTILPPDLAPIAFQATSLLTGPPNPSVTLVWGVTNQGLGPAVINNGSWADAVYFSKNATLDAADVVIGSQSEPGPVNVGETYWRTNTVRVPVVSNTNCYLIFKTDAYNTLYESNETNNTFAVPLKVNILPPDLTPVAFQVPNAITSPPRPTVTFVWGVTNQGTGAADPGFNGSWSDSLYVSTNSVFDNTAVYVGNTYESTPIPVAGSYWRTNAFSLPILQSGTYFLFFTADATRTIYESDFANNTVTAPVTFTIQPPDLAVVAFQAPATITAPPKPKVTTVWGVTNQGIGPALGSWGDSLFISSKPVLDYNATVVTAVAENGPLNVGDTYWRTNTWTLPVTQSGTYYLFFETDSGDPLYESNTSNNQAYLSISIVIQPPDLSPVALLVTNFVIGSPFPSVSFVWGVTNQGLGAAVSDWLWQDQLSLCPNSDPYVGCTTFGNFSESGIVPAGSSYWRTNNCRVPVVSSGTYFVRFETDSNDALYESSFTNNQITVPVTFQIRQPDLAPIAFKSPRTVTGTPNPQVKLSWGVTNQGAGEAFGNGSWSDRVYLSQTPVLENALAVTSSWESRVVTPGGNYWRSQTVSIPVTQSGNYYLIFVADADHNLYDANYSNNTLVVPITFNITPPDLAPILFQAPTTISGAGLTNVTLVWGVTNQGVGPASTPGGWGWCDSVVLSTAPGGTWYDTYVCSSCGQDEIPPGGTYWKTNTVRLPVTKSGNYYFILQADAGNSITESTETNNTIAVPVTINVELPDLAPLALQVPDPIAGPPNLKLTIAYAITNQGAGLAFGQNGWQDQIWFSNTNVFDGTEISLSSIYQYDPILPGDTYWTTNTILLPAVQSGQYYLLLKTDVNSYLQEANETNNLLVVPINVIIQPSDVAIMGLTVPSVFPNSRFPIVTISWGVTNQGPGTAGNGWNWWQAVYLSTVPVFDTNAIYVSFLQQTNSLPPGGSQWFTNDVTLPLTASGRYYILVTANGNNNLYELNVSNDLAAAPFTYSVELPDLAPITLQAPDFPTIPPDPWVTLSWGVTNQGRGAATVQGGWPWIMGSWSDYLWLSTSSNVDSTAVFIAAFDQTNTLPSGESYWRTNTVQLPISQSGTYYLIFAVNFWNNAVESNLSNNTVVVPIVATVQPPDLTPLVFQVPQLITGQPYPEITVVWGVTNQGSGTALPPYTPPGDTGYYYWRLVDALYVSLTPNADDSWDSPAAIWERTAPILPGTSYTRTNTVRLPVSSSGTYYLVFRTDAFQTVVESNEFNNSVAIPVTFHLSPPADLTALSLIAPRTISGPGNLPVTIAWHAINQGFSPVTGRWRDFLYLYSPLYGSTYLGTSWIDGPLAVGEDYWQTNTVIFPLSQSGDYQLGLAVGSDLGDLDNQDNGLTVPITVNITGPPDVRLGNPQIFPGDVFQVSAYGTVGAYYTLQGSSDLTNWSRVLDFFCAQDPMTLVDRDARNYAWRFYRLARMTNAPPLRIDLGTPQPWTGNGLLLKLDGPPGVPWQLEASTDLSDWQPLTTFTNTIVPKLFLDSSATNYPRRFYRTVYQ